MSVSGSSKDRQFREEALPHLPAVSSFALSLTHDEPAADDLVQETFLRAYRSWDQYESGTECRAWLFTICRNTWLRTRKREGREIACEDGDLEALAAAAVHASAAHGGLADVFERGDVGRALHGAIATLPPAFREVVVLVDLEDHTYEQTSRVLGVPVGTVRSRLFRGRRLLQEQLIDHARDAGFAAPRTDSGTDRGKEA